MNTLPDVQVRRAGPLDAAVLAALRHEFRAPLAPPIEGPDAFLARSTSWMRSRLADNARWRAWLFEAGGEPVGNIWLQLVEKLPNPGAEPELHAYITNFFVRPEHRNLGGGRALLRTALASCDDLDVDTIFLWPTSRSTPLYQRFGFTAAEGMMTLVRSRVAHAAV